jgi:hypothetical protein
MDTDKNKVTRGSDARVSAARRNFSRFAGLTRLTQTQ